MEQKSVLRKAAGALGTAVGVGLLAVPIVFVVVLLEIRRFFVRVNSPLKRRAAIRYLNRKYGTRFRYLEDKPYKIGSGDVFGRHGNSVHMYVTCDEFPDKKIFVAGVEGRPGFYCNYTAVKYEDKTLALLTSIAKDVYGESARVFWQGTDGDRMGCMDRDATFEDYLACGEIGSFDVFTDKNDDMTGDFLRLVNELAARRIECRPQSYHFADKVYDSIENRRFVYDIPSEQKCGHCHLHFTQSILAEGYVPDIVFRSSFV